MIVRRCKLCVTSVEPFSSVGERRNALLRLQANDPTPRSSNADGSTLRPGPAGPSALAGLARADEPSETFFELKIRPVLATECLPVPRRQEDEQRPEGRLARGAAQGRRPRAGDRGRRPGREPADPGDPPDPRRGQDAAQAAAARRTVAAFAKWIAEGAVWPDGTGPVPLCRQGTAAPRHWAFEPVKAVEPPPDPTGWSDRPDRSVHRRPAPSGRPATRAPRRPGARSSAASRST